MAVTLRFSVWGDDAINRELLRFQHRAVDMRPAFAALHEDMLDELRLNFETEGAHGGTKWPPLKEETLLAKQAAGLPPAILHATLALRDSLIDREGDDHVFVPQSDSMVFGSTIFYGGFHQQGVPVNNLPVRKPLQFNEAAKVGFMKTLQRYMVEGSLGVQAAI